MELEKLQQLYAAKINEAKKLAEAWKGKEAEVPTEVATQIDGLLGQADEVKVKIDLAQRLADGNAFINEPGGTKAAHLGWREAGPSEGMPAVDPHAWRKMEVDTPAGKKELRYLVPLAVQAKGYGPAFEAYLTKGFDGLGPADRKTLTEGVDTAGGFTVPEDYQAELLKKTAANAVIRAMARKITTSRDIVKWPRVNYTTDDKYTSGVRLTWTGESPVSASVHRVTDPVFGTVAIPVHTAMASMPISNDLIEDSAFDLLGISSDLLAEAFSLGEDDVFLNGTGIGQPMGILTEVDTNGPASVNSGHATEVTANGLIDLHYGLPSQYRRTARYIMNSATAKAARKLTDTDGRYMWDGLNGGLYSPLDMESLGGKPVEYDEFMPDIAASAYAILFGDLRGYLVVDRVGFSVQRLSEIYAETNLTLLLARKRVGGYTAEPYRMKVQKISA